MPISQANAEQKESHMAQERAKTRQFLHKFLNVCSATQVYVKEIDYIKLLNSSKKRKGNICMMIN